MTLTISNLHVRVEEKEILKGVDLTVKPGEIHALMGPNGSGKSSLANALMGNPQYAITGGEVMINDENILSLSPDLRAQKGLFLSFQYPAEIPGVTLSNFLRTAVNLRADQKNQMSIPEFYKHLQEQMKALKIDPSFASRYLNDGFSGGEKKRAEILQMSLLKPRYAILDEIDSGLDVDALKLVAEGIKRVAGPTIGIIIITHYSRILQYITPDFVHILVHGKLVASGDKTLAHKIESQGYDWLLQKSVEA